MKRKTQVILALLGTVMVCSLFYACSSDVSKGGGSGSSYTLSTLVGATS